VIDIRVFGIPDNVYGESICACVNTNQSGVKEKIEEISMGLPPHKKIRRIVLFNHPFPTNKNGKVDITALRKKVGGAYEL
jgi:acyl-CoA synthetase (AMP-forming)/AMP-acid ligase II